jgi:5-methylcytosine-specific restriction endonuclease McrA
VSTYRSRTVHLDYGQEWHFLLNVDGKWHDPHADRVVGVPFSAINNLKDEEIGKLVRHASSLGLAVEAYHTSVDILNTPTDQLSSEIEILYEQRSYLARYHKYQRAIADALVVLDNRIQRVEARNRRKSEKIQSRQYIAKNYDSLFVQVGRRDGFHCANCQLTTDLQLDHVKPLALGGTNDTFNLQLLCAACNMSKGATEVDYRTTGGAS